MEKKEKNVYGRSFAKRLTWRIMLTMLVVMGLSSVLIFKVSSGFIATGAWLLGNRMVKDKSTVIQHVLADIYVASTNTIPDIEASLDNPDALTAIMERIVRLNPHIRSCGVSFVENYYPGKGRLFCPYAIQRDSATIETMNLNDAAHDYLQAPWFVQGLEATERYWSEPFYDGTDKKTPLVSCMAPIHDSEGRTVAVFGADYLLKGLNDEVTGELLGKVNGNNLSYAIYFFITDSAGTYIMHPDEKRILRDNFMAMAAQTTDTTMTGLGKRLAAGVEGSYGSLSNECDLMMENTNVQAFYFPVSHTNWMLCLVVPILYVDIVSYILGGVLLLIIGIGLVVVFFVGRRSIRKAVKPLGQLAASAGEVAKGNFEAPLPEVSSNDEIHLLRDSFEKMQQSLSLYVDELKMTTIQKASIESELKVAHTIQMSMLPKTFPPYPERDDIDIYGMLKPAKAVGGDLFDFYIRNEKLLFCIGDVSGKGVPASLFMAVTRSLFRNVSLHQTEPHRIVETLNNSMSEGNEECMFVTLFVGVLDLKTGVLDYCNAGHNAPVIIDDEVAWLECDSNFPVGLMADHIFSWQRLTLTSQTTIFLYTDGLNEAENAAHDQFGDDRIIEVLREQLQQHGTQPQPLVERMIGAVHSFVGEAEQSDDLTLLAIRYQ